MKKRHDLVSVSSDKTWSQIGDESRASHVILENYDS